MWPAIGGIGKWLLMNVAPYIGIDMALNLFRDSIPPAERKQLELMAQEAQMGREAQTAFRKEDEAKSNQNTALALMLGLQNKQTGLATSAEDAKIAGMSGMDSAKAAAGQVPGSFERQMDQPLDLSLLTGLY